MKKTYRECDGCGKRIEWKDGQFPANWAILKLPSGDDSELCASCVQDISASVAKRKKSSRSNESEDGVGT